jgi:hypothetical protein
MRNANPILDLQSNCFAFSASSMSMLPVTRRSAPVLSIDAGSPNLQINAEPITPKNKPRLFTMILQVIKPKPELNPKVSQRYYCPNKALQKMGI